MPTYTINGKKIKTDRELSDSDIDEIAANLGVGSSKETDTAGPVIGSEAAYQIPGQSAKAPAPLAESPSSFIQGVLDPFRGGSQAIASGLGALGSTWGQEEAKRMQESISETEKAYQAQRKAAGEEGMDWARVVGNVVSPANIVALPAKGASALASLLKAGTVSGTLEPVTSTEEGTYGEQKAKQIGTALVGATVGGAATKAAGAVLNPLVSKAEQTMRELGVQMTPGQMLGGQAKALEEFAANMPLVGKYIADAREKSLFSFNKGVINKALDRIGSKLPEDVIGRDAVAFTQQQVDNAYDDVLSRISYKLDFPAYSGMLKALKTPSSVLDRTRVQDELNTRIFSRLPKGEAIDGDTYKMIESDLRARISQLQRGSVSDQDVASALKEAANSLKESMKKQNPKETPALRRIDAAYRDLTIMETAAAKTGAVNGVFTPKQYQAAVREGDITKRKRQFAAGTARGQDIADAAVQALEKDAASTLEGRLALQTTGSWAALQNPAIAGTLAVTAPIMYSESGIKALNTIMRSRPEVAKKIGDVLTKRATKEGSITGAQVLEEYQRSLQTEK